MGSRYRVLHFRHGEVIEETRHGSRDDAESVFALGVEHAERQAAETDTDCRVELWGEDALLGVYDTADRP